MAEMASSLEDLLAQDGFRGRQPLTRSRTCSRSDALGFARYSFAEQHKKEFRARDRIRTERSRSDVTWYNMKGESPNDNSRGRRAVNNLVRGEKIDGGAKKQVRDRLKGRDSANMREGKVSDSSSEKLPANEIVEVGDEVNGRYKDIYSNAVCNSEIGKDKYSKKHILGRLGFTENNRKSVKHPGTSSERSNNTDRGSSSNSKSFEDSSTQRNDNVIQGVFEPALGEVAIQAIVSILSGYIKRFLKDEDFRITLRHNCFSSLNFIELEEGHSESKIILNLEQAIETVEKAVEESTNAKDLKKAILQLSVIAGLNSNELKDGFTSGVPNYKLSACSHLYLSAVYKLQKKDKASAKHLLQVFCDSPFQARTTLLPELWDYLFFPHLSHLKVWYNQEADSIADTPSRPRKLKLLEKVYNEILDTGTHQFAVYYKDWLTEGVETPSIPSIHIPSVSIKEVQQESFPVPCSGISSPDGAFSMKTMVSKKLYDDVFGRSSKPGFNEAEDVREPEYFDDDSIRSSEGSAVVKQTLTQTAKDTDQDIEEDSTKSAPDDAFCPENGHLITEKKWTFVEERDSPDNDLNEKFGNSSSREETSENTQLLHSPPYTNENELILKRLAKSVFQMQQPESYVDLTVSTLSNSSEASISHSLQNATKVTSSFQELHGGYLGEKSSFSSIPQEFICPLTGQLFEDPVTLETGETFERAAIKDWFNQGNRTCPATGKYLEYVIVPSTNLVLKRVIDGWKSEHCKHLLAFASQILGNTGGDGLKYSDETAIFMLEQLLTAFSKEERTTNAKHLIALGGLQFLLQRFESGNLEDKTRVVALLSCCIEADSGCRNQVARDIDKQCLLELLHSKQDKSRTNVVLLLTELICLKRKKDVTLFLSGLQNEGIVNTMHILLVYLQSSPAAERPVVAVLLLYLDLLVEPRKYSIYREEAVDAITEALDGSLADEKVRKNCCRALLILGGRFSCTGKLLTESWILKQAGFYGYHEVNPSLPSEEDDILLDDASSVDDEEEHANEEWLRNLSASLLGNGKRSFFETISKYLGSENLDLTGVCLTTTAWLSFALASLSDTEFQLSALSSLISQLKESLETSQQVEHKILASMSLFNLSKISECRVLMTEMAEDIAAPLQSLAEVTWTAKLLYAIISGKDL